MAAVTSSALAVFSDTETIENNTVATATVDIDLRALGSGEIDKPFDVEGLVPGAYSDWGRVEVYNTIPSTDVRVFFFVKDVTGAACPKINLDLRTGHAGSDAGERALTVYSGALNGVKGAGNRVEITGPGMIFNPVLHANWTAVVQQRAQLDTSAGNAYQNTACTWTEVFVAETP